MSLFERFANFSLFQKKDKEDSASNENQKGFAIDRQQHADSTVVGVSDIDAAATGGLQISGVGASLVPQEESEAIIRCRQLANEAEINLALQEIRNEVFIFDEQDGRAFEIAFKDDANSPTDRVQKLIVEEFNKIYDLMDFRNRGLDYFNDFYIDGKYFWHMVVDSNNPKAGLKRVIPLDPLDIRRLTLQEMPDKNGVINLSKSKDVFIHAQNLMSINNNFKKMNQAYTLGINDPFLTNPLVSQINPDAIVYVNSGLYDKTNNRYRSHLEQAIVPFNRLRMAEDSMLIFRVVRAPQRRAIYVDVGGMPPAKQESYLKKLMQNHKNKIVYDNKTGSLVNNSNIQSMLEDYWLPRTSNGRTTEIQTLDGQTTQDMLDEVQYYRTKLYQALKVPLSRFGENQGTFVFGRDNEISRDEYRFNKFLSQLRSKFIEGVEQVLRTQVILKNIVTKKDWEQIQKSISWKFNEDNAFIEMKEAQAIKAKIDAISQLEPYIGKYFSHQYVRDKILHQSKEEQDIIDRQNQEWKEKNPEPENPDDSGNRRY